MPNSMLHLAIAKKFNPDASIDFFIGNIAPDANQEREKKDKVHLYDVPDREYALRKFALKANTEYLKGMLLHLFVDGKWWEAHLSGFAEKEGEGWYAKYDEENRKMASYAVHNTEWANLLYEKMENWDYGGFTETEFITKDDIQSFIHNQRKWQKENILVSSSVFPPALVEKFAEGTVADFNKWLFYLKK